MNNSVVVASQPPGQITPLRESTSSKPQWNPHEYQKRAITLLLSQASGGLLLDPGLGKTSICLAALKILFQQGYIKKALIVAPLRPMYTVWPAEIQKWTDFNQLTYRILHSKAKDLTRASDVQIDLINPEGLQWLFTNAARPHYDVLIVDESTKFKDSQTKRFKLLRPIIGSFARRWILTGTPAPNGLEDLFGQVFILDLGRSLGRYITHYRREFFDPDFTGYNWTPKKGSFDLVVDRISPLTLRLSAEEHLAMPALDFRTILVSLPEPVMQMYKQMEDQFIFSHEDYNFVAGTSAVASGKMRQIANGAIYKEPLKATVLHDEKLDALESLLAELEGHPVLVLYEFRHDLVRITQRFPQAVDLGSIAGNSLLRTVDAFNRGDIQLLLGHPAGMGHGLNLQGSCHHIIWFSIPWNLEHYDQAIARVYRQGQKSEFVRVYHIAAKGTIDERVLRVLDQKDRTQQDLLEAINERNITA